MHGVEGHAEAAGEHRADRREVEQRCHQRGVVGDRVDDLDGHAAELLGAERSRSRSGASRIWYSSISLVRAKIASVIFSGAGPPLPILYLMPKSPFGPPGLWLAERMMPPKAWCSRMTWRGGGGREDAALADQHPAEAVGGGHLQRDLDDLAVVVAAVAADHEGLAREALQAVEDRLDEVLDVVRLLEVRHLLAQARGAGLLVVDRAWSRWVSIMRMAPCGQDEEA